MKQAVLASLCAILALPAANAAVDAHSGWTGDTDAITDGSADGPIVRINTTRPVSLVANYVRGNTPPMVIVVK